MRPICYVVRRVGQTKGSSNPRGRGRPRKTIGETIMKDLEVNDLDKDMIEHCSVVRSM